MIPQLPGEKFFIALFAFALIGVGSLVLSAVWVLILVFQHIRIKII